VLLALGESLEPAGAPALASERLPATMSRRLRVLVVEDNAVNQMLIVRLLERLGHEIVVRGNGQEAVETYEAGTFDLVLMDLQMPVMDGLTATTIIRQQETRHPDRRRLPIVAVTAAAMRGDRERCLAAGMDDYLTKPIKPEDLTAMLNRLFPDLSAAAVRCAPAESAPEPTFDLTAALTYVDGDRALLDELLDTFAQDTPVRLEAIREAATGWEATELIREAHTLKGVLKVLGATRAAGLAKDLEARGRAGDVKGARELVASLTREVEQILSSLLKR
jgi:CheY-like chemotaxis protein/HPt (histidine-containing phosphotransfer) domain-containing protein